MQLLFIHRGRSPWLSYVLSQAESLKIPITLIGDEDARSMAMPTVVAAAIEDYSQFAKPIQDVYRHMSTNVEKYEYQCFERWWILAEFVRQMGPTLLLDSDVLVYPGLLHSIAKASENGSRILDIPWCIAETERGQLDLVRDYFRYVFETPAAAERVSRLAFPHDAARQHVSDMHALWTLARDNPGQFTNLRTMGFELGIDNNIQDARHFEAIHNFKRPLGFRANQPVFRALDGREIPFSLLHLQGRSKFLMDHFCTCPTDELPDLKFWFRQHGNRAHPQYADVLAFDNYLRLNPLPTLA